MHSCFQFENSLSPLYYEVASYVYINHQSISMMIKMDGLCPGLMPDVVIFFSTAEFQNKPLCNDTVQEELLNTFD